MEFGINLSDGAIIIYDLTIYDLRFIFGIWIFNLSDGAIIIYDLTIYDLLFIFGIWMELNFLQKLELTILRLVDGRNKKPPVWEAFIISRP